MNMLANAAVDPAEVKKFDALAHEFWDAKGAFRPLHSLNPVRVAYVAERVPLSQRRVLDIGCGGGLLTEALTRHGAHVTGIDMSQQMVEIARLHSHESQLAIDYHQCTAEQFAERTPHSFDVITCMELIEHVPDPSTVLAAAARMLNPGGALFISTINRNLRSFLLAIVGAEYLLKLLPRGTHEYARLVKPSELARSARAEGFALRDVSGLEFNPFTQQARLSRDTSINYLAHLERGYDPT